MDKDSVDSAGRVPEEARMAIDLMVRRFGIPETAFDDYELIRRSPKYLSLMVVDHEAPSRPPATSTGVPFLRTNLRFPKPTTAAVMLFGRHARCNVIGLSRAQALAYVRREDVELDESQTACCTDRGYVIVRHLDLILGVGYYPGSDRPPVLKSLYPRSGV